MNIVILQSYNSFWTIWSLQSVDKLASESSPDVITKFSFPFKSPWLCWRYPLENSIKWIIGLKRHHLHCMTSPNFISPLKIFFFVKMSADYGLLLIYLELYFEAESMIKKSTEFQIRIPGLTPSPIVYYPYELWTNYLSFSDLYFFYL